MNAGKVYPVFPSTIPCSAFTSPATTSTYLWFPRIDIEVNMAQPRSQHYWRQLRGALTAGQWDATAPAKDWHQRPCSWSELIRKFLKHSPDHRDVAELASQTQALCLLLSANATNLDGSDVGPRGPLVLGEECALPEERIEEASAGYESLKQLDASRSDVREAVSQIQTLF